MRFTNRTEHYVRESLLQVIALVSKRGWIEDSPTEKEIPFARLTGLLSPSAALDAHSIGLSLLSALLNEFGSDKASAVGLPNEFHLRCHRSFEVFMDAPLGTFPLIKFPKQMERLLPLLGQLFTVMHPLTSQITGALSPDQGAVLGLCFNVLDKILSWEFLQTGMITLDRQMLFPHSPRTCFKIEDGDVSSKALLSNSHNNLLEETGVASCTRFPPPWREALGRPDVIEMLFRV